MLHRDALHQGARCGSFILRTSPLCGVRPGTLFFWHLVAPSIYEEQTGLYRQENRNNSVRPVSPVWRETDQLLIKFMVSSSLIVNESHSTQIISQRAHRTIKITVVIQLLSSQR